MLSNFTIVLLIKKEERCDWQQSRMAVQFPELLFVPFVVPFVVPSVPFVMLFVVTFVVLQVVLLNV